MRSEAAKLRADERYRRLAQAIGLKLAEYDLRKHLEPFEVEVDVTTVPFDPYEVPGWHFGIGATHTARTSGGFRITAEGQFLMLFKVRPLTEEVTP